jgi:polyhydroxyalkanoate synthesis regulator phasin
MRSKMQEVSGRFNKLKQQENELKDQLVKYGKANNQHYRGHAL